MPVSEGKLDAGFFNLIHQLTGTCRPQSPAERRQRPRHPFPSRQRIAVSRGPGIPDDAEFIEVRCHDLTRQGFSFLFPGRPEFTSLVAALGTPPDMIYVAAEVSHWADVLVDSSGRVEHVGTRTARRKQANLEGQNATPMVLVGCRFSKRLRK
jgi:hypothetical protein